MCFIDYTLEGRRRPGRVGHRPGLVVVRGPTPPGGQKVKTPKIVKKSKTGVLAGPPHDFGGFCDWTALDPPRGGFLGF